MLLRWCLLRQQPFVGGMARGCPSRSQQTLTGALPQACQVVDTDSPPATPLSRPPSLPPASFRRGGPTPAASPPGTTGHTCPSATLPWMAANTPASFSLALWIPWSGSHPGLSWERILKLFQSLPLSPSPAQD